MNLRDVPTADGGIFGDYYDLVRVAPEGCLLAIIVERRVGEPDVWHEPRLLHQVYVERVPPDADVLFADLTDWLHRLEVLA